MELYLIRHTRPATDAGICYGQSDIELAHSFDQDAVSVREKLAGVETDTCFSSPLQRCSRLAQAIGHARPYYDARLLELDFGAWEMRPWDAISRHELDRWGQDYVDAAPPGGETFRALHARASAFLNDLRDASSTMGTAVAVTHAGVIRALLAEVLQLPLNETFRFHLDYGSVTQLHLDGSFASVGFVNR